MERSALDAQNRMVIAEFRARDGKVGGIYEGMPLLLLHHIGARTGTRRINPLTYQDVDGGYAVFASNDAAPAHPAWYHNLVAHPEVTVEVGTATFDVVARVADGEEHDRIWSRQLRRNPYFVDFARRTSRRIPVVVLERPRGSA